MAQELAEKERGLIGSSLLSEYLDATLNTWTCGIIITNEVGRFVHWNKQAAKYLAISPLDLYRTSDDWDSIYKCKHLDGSEMPANEIPGAIALRSGIEVRRDLLFSNGVDDFRVTVTAKPIFVQGEQRGIAVFLEDLPDDRG